MSSKIVRDKSRLTKFSMRQFSPVEKGTHNYQMKEFSFDEESSVQDPFNIVTMAEPPTITTVFDEVSDDVYLPPSKLAKAEDGLRGEKVSLFSGNIKGSGFVESPLFIDIEEEQEEYPTRVITASSPKKDNNQIETDDNKAVSSDPQIAELESIIATKNLEIETVKASMATQMQTAIEEAKTSAYEKGKEENLAIYSAEKADYISKLEAFNNASLAKLNEIDTTIKSIDKDIPEIVINYINKIIGAERKINNEFIINLIHKNLDKLTDLKIVSFAVNPADLDIMKEKLSDYVVSTDTAISAGSAKVNTKVGEVVLDTKVMIDDLEYQINAELKSIKNS